MFNLELGHFFISRLRVLAGSFTQITENVFTVRHGSKMCFWQRSV